MAHGTAASVGIPEPHDHEKGNPATAITVVVPRRNEAGNVEALLDRLGPGLSDTPAEVIFVDDSDDDAPDRVRQLGRPAQPPGPEST